jgi:DNA helicase-2/ATP-dependent DNA helicase PcrA
MKLIDFYNYILLRNADQQSINDYEDGVFLMTLHSAKGLEFENVIFTGLEENICPYKWPGLKKISEDQLDEEKRLFYVGITRAKKNLVLTYARKREWFSKETMNKPSRFLKLIPSRLIHILK